MTFSPQGRGHQVLQALRHDGWSHDDLIRLIVRGPNWSHHRAAHFLILALIDAGFSVGAVGTPRVQFTGRVGEAAKNPSPVAG